MSRPLAAPHIHYSYTTMQRLHSKYHEAYAGQWFSSNLPDSGVRAQVGIPPRVVALSPQPL